MEFECTLDNKTFVCEFKEGESGCKGNQSCCFCREILKDEPTLPKEYVRKERWYEKYYEKDGTLKKRGEYINPWK